MVKGAGCHTTAHPRYLLPLFLLRPRPAPPSFPPFASSVSPAASSCKHTYYVHGIDAPWHWKAEGLHQPNPKKAPRGAAALLLGLVEAKGL